MDYLPGHFVVQVTEREQLSCRRCRGLVVTALTPPTAIEGSVAGVGLLAKSWRTRGRSTNRLSASSAAWSAKG